MVKREWRRAVHAPELFGTQAAIRGGGRRAPDRRRVSLRWMAGTILTGATSLALMGAALHTAFNGREDLAFAPSVMTGQMAAAAGGATRGDRPFDLIASEPVGERVMQVPTLTRSETGNIIRKRPFVYAIAPLAVEPARRVSYPAFDPLRVFRASRSDALTAGASNAIYSADIEGEVRIADAPFPLEGAEYDPAQEISVEEAHASVHAMRDRLEGATALAALPYLDTGRFSLSDAGVDAISGLDIRVTAENVSTALPDETVTAADFGEEVLAVPRPQPLAAALTALRLDAGMVTTFDRVLAAEGAVSDGRLPAGSRLRVAWEVSAGADPVRKPRRIAAYRDGVHVATVAMDDAGAVRPVAPPAPVQAVLERDEGEVRLRTLSGADLPSVYDGLHAAALSQGLSVDHARRIVRTVAFDVDFRARIDPRDRLEVFYSATDGATGPSADSEILYIGLTRGGRTRHFYRFVSAKGQVAYFDENGQSSRKFLLRQPVPNGKFRSGFGRRRHPISRRWKMHQGVDFSAPRGTPILAAGRGTVEKAGWAGGYGRQLILRHANGYKTSYNHMHRFAKGMKPGARVRQGQVIGSVGSTGYSTGPHLHYEVLVNGARVNPMKIRLPRNSRLTGDDLAAFQRERERIDALLQRAREGNTTLASL